MTTGRSSAVPEPLALSRYQRSHLILLFLDPAEDGGSPDATRRILEVTAKKQPGVCSLRLYVKDPVDITEGHHPPPPGQVLAMCEVAVDGADEASPIADAMTAACDAAGILYHACWIYFPASERVGRKAAPDSAVTIALASARKGQETDFAEWYATRHIRHALNIPALVNGQCFHRSLVQPGRGQEPPFQVLALYGTEGSSESIIAACAAIPPETFAFPSLDPECFAEAVYRPAL